MANGSTPTPAPLPEREPLDDDWMGPDEEGDVIPPTGRPDDDKSAWVHVGDEPGARQN
ncbi:hypothetical protein FHS96_002525 [Sphingomonas zeicaulis]|uniref:hypothetical protein n=1 Tax=Sphingomonas zeicaulis TaxID=1632740 RepID=UPI003D20F3D4